MATALPRVDQPEVPLAAWAGRSVAVAEVMGHLDRMRRSEHTATRTAVVNLVVATSDREAARRARLAMHRLGRHHPGRTLALVLRPERPQGIDARVELHRRTIGERAVWWEEVSLEVGGPLCAQLDSLVAPLLLPQVPVVVWYPSVLPGPEGPLVASAEVVLADARWAVPAHTSGDPLAALVDLGRRHVVIDLSWQRLTPWRRLLADLFEPHAVRPFVDAVVRAEIAGHAGPARLLGGWLLDRLGLPPAAVTLRRGRHAGIRLSAEHGGRRARF
ncbi:MAG TPA: glucose-6-phosphate dehydrogenase assembly protein OpcA, partial [Acidimicrobiales bacterium]|nr:glucose-6-phosphate dehydrogenase assembly protein OpcA [Acidimicrobiales bacterium]